MRLNTTYQSNSRRIGRLLSMICQFLASRALKPELLLKAATVRFAGLGV